MYNKEQKMRFIASYTSSVGRKTDCIALFNKLERYEEEWQADICTREANEVEPIVNKELGLRARASESRVSILKAYVKWCLENNIPGANEGMLDLKYDGIWKVKRGMVRDPEHLQEYLNILFYPVSKNTMDNVFRAFCWLAYAGCAEEDILNLTSDNIDFSSMIVRVEKESGVEEFPIYKEAVDALKSCVESTSFLFIHPNYTSDIERDRVVSKQLLRGVKTETSASRIRIGISKRNRVVVEDGKTELKLSYYKIWLSGIFYRTYLLEKTGVEPNFMELAGKFMSGKNYKLDSGRNTIEAKQRAIAKDYLNDYYRWKIAFMI